MNDARSRLILALDVPDRQTALARVSLLSGHVGCFKVGLELFVREGPRLVEDILGLGEKVFLDLKLHDIPNTVAGAVRSAGRLGVQMLTVHASGGAEMLKAAHVAAESAETPPVLLAVTALTSISQPEAQRMGIGTPLGQWVQRLAQMAIEAGIQGLVASSLEVKALRQRFGAKPQIVVPGIRPAGAASQDQARTGQPGDAIRAGADYLVVGRPVLQDPDPPGAADRIVAEIANATELL